MDQPRLLPTPSLTRLARLSAICQLRRKRFWLRWTSKDRNNMRAFFHELAESLEKGETVALATIVKRRGSVPREIGAKMIVHQGGAITGTVGGGCGEAEIWRSALSVIETGRPQSVFVDLTEEISLSSQGVCGGTYEVFVQPWS